MRKTPLLTVASLACLTLSLASPGSAAPPAQTADLEQRFDAEIKPDELRDWMKTLTSQPNQVGSPHDKANADYILGLFKSWGWDAHIETFDVLYPTPITVSLELTGAKGFKATLQEPPIPGDSTSANTAGALPAYVAYQGDGDVTAQIVYVNYGMPTDYEDLARMGVDVKGKIVLARYGGGWRGLKPKLAQEHGAAGCIIYSDPADDGYAQADVYPKGPMRPEQGIQRGSVADMTLYPGDPLTPGVGSVKGAKRLTRAEAPTILKIPALPISYGDALRLLENMTGPVAPKGWRGALPVTYHAGPSAEPVHLVVKSDWSQKPVYDVIATLKGDTLPDEWVIRGNHHDGWVFGASDPMSGQVALLAEAQALGNLYKAGWRPKRSIVYASWDAEEPMLLGSTEWAETHAAELKTKGVLYINSDGNARGFLGAEGSHDFQHLVNDVARDVQDPETHVSVFERQRAKAQTDALEPGANEQTKAEGKIAADPAKDLPIGPLGSGSDYSSFIQHLGLPAIDLGYGGEGRAGGVYHSVYDTFDHHRRFVDPGFVYDALLAKTVGRVVIRVADSDLPLQRASDFADAVATYIDEVGKLADTRRQEVETRDRLIAQGAYKLSADPSKTDLPPEVKDLVPHPELAPLKNALTRLKRSAKAYDDAMAAHGAGLAPDKAQQVRGLILTLDQTLAPDVGLPGRPWYKHLIYAPGRLTGYGAKTLPGVREAIEDGRWADADKYAKLTAGALEAYAARLDAATVVLNGG